MRSFFITAALLCSKLINQVVGSFFIDKCCAVSALELVSDNVLDFLREFQWTRESRTTLLS